MDPAECKFNVMVYTCAIVHVHVHHVFWCVYMYVCSVLVCIYSMILIVHCC